MDGMRQEFGLWWTTKEIADLREMGILGLDMQGWQVQRALSGFQQAREKAPNEGIGHRLGSRTAVHDRAEVVRVVNRWGNGRGGRLI